MITHSFIYLAFENNAFPKKKYCLHSIRITLVILLTNILTVYHFLWSHKLKTLTHKSTVQSVTHIHIVLIIKSRKFKLANKKKSIQKLKKKKKRRRNGTKHNRVLVRKLHMLSALAGVETTFEFVYCTGIRVC